jgi:hypothetical protein
VSLSSDGSILAVGAKGSVSLGTDAGQVKVFKEIEGECVQMSSNINGEAEDDRSGISVSLSSNGNRVAIGAELNDGIGLNSGHVRIFEYVNDDWTQIGEDIDGDTLDDMSGHQLA